MEKLVDRITMAEALGVKPSWLTIKVRQNEIPFIRLPGSNYLRFDPEEVIGFIKNKNGGGV